MKRIEAIVRTEIMPDLKIQLERFEIYGLSMHNITSPNITSRNGAVGRGGGLGEFLTKVELIVSDRDAKRVIDTISAVSGKHKEYTKIFVSSLEEIVDVSHMHVIKDLEDVNDSEDRTRKQDSSIASSGVDGEHGNYSNEDSTDRIDASSGEYEEQEKRSRLVPLQKYTLMRVLKFYNANKDTLRSEYRIKSFSDFVNFCILGYLPIIESEIKQQSIEGRSKLLRI
ncbi:MULTISPECIES: P-II family nitrogen regulator [Candidatus Nitrosocaldus]|jgi:nitrogen regulatory protein P-II 1|uniref:Putative Nitrogen regulatory protein P-II 2 n=1 Tax=Candidatus Nitrosocaldus cavascurensis TaxID=2058097 RepID=A0A2K5ATA3_9ARCH|nr:MULTISPECIES: P-II family nitrogen regulator [Candidatus Nitrosocaldus]SPC34865.1 putative Nitrogen regulatory protein P-II 2 [Candidatus Nitrosocaldus cavascurensis]